MCVCVNCCRGHIIADHIFSSEPGFVGSRVLQAVLSYTLSRPAWLGPRLITGGLFKVQFSRQIEFLS